jgi:hypothetical protein
VACECAPGWTALPVVSEGICGFARGEARKGGGGLELGMAVPPVGAGARGCQTHWVRVWVHPRVQFDGPGVDFHSWVTHGARKRANLHSYTY